MHAVLICDDDSVFHLDLKKRLGNRFHFQSAYHSQEAYVLLKKYPIDLILLDVHMRTPHEGLNAIPQLLQIKKIPIVITSASNDFKIVKEAMRLGATDYFVKNINLEELTETIDCILQSPQKITVTHNTPLLGQSPAMLELKRKIKKIQTIATHILITGETGTGKELVARQLQPPPVHNVTPPFITIDSATIQASTAESTLFGHEKGSFTGATQLNRGIFEEADQGILYFDEIANMPLEIQAKLLRVLQEKEISRLGSTKKIRLNFQIICATNQNLEHLCKQGLFKYDLLQRINVIPLEVPPLRNRKEDIPLLLKYFAEKYTFTHQPIEFTTETLGLLTTYPWPGNVRELSNLVIFLSSMTENPLIQPSDLPHKFSEKQNPFDPLLPIPEESFYQIIKNFESKVLQQNFIETQGNIRKLATRLKMDRSHLYAKLKEFGIYQKKLKLENNASCPTD